jgi:Zn-finger nucleic acid-binding protein
MVGPNALGKCQESATGAREAPGAVGRIRARADRSVGSVRLAWLSCPASRKIARVKQACVHCKKPNAPLARKCVHCGRSKPATARAEHRAISCPLCRAPAHLVQLASITVDVCGQCAGLWLDKHEVAELPAALSDEDMRESARATLEALRSHEAEERKAAYLACPVCSSTMRRHNYLDVSGIVLDQCAQHGTWADHENATRLLELLDGTRLAELREHARQSDGDAKSRRLLSLESRQRSLSHQLNRVETRQRWHLVLDLLDIL